LPQVRRARQVVRRVDVWTVLRFSLLLYVSILIVLIVAGTLLWLVASSTGIIGGIEDFIKELFGLETFSFAASRILQGTVLGGLVIVLIGTGMNTLVAILYNLITEVVGGIEVVLADQESAGDRVL
jgi:hypothetical protein